MNLYVVSSAFQLLGVIDDASSVIWTSRYQAAGDFEIYLGYTTQHLELLQPGHIVLRDDWKRFGLIQTVTMSNDPEIGNYITVTGKDGAGILGRRIIWEQTVVSGTVEDCMRTLVTQNIISPSKTTRKIDGFGLAARVGYTDKMTKQMTGDNLLEALSEICAAYGYGFAVELDSDYHFRFRVYKGEDRSERQSTLPHVVFSPAYDNVATSEYAWDDTNYANVALVAGEGEGTARRRTAVGDTAGISRVEIYVDARNISSNDGEITDEEYMAQLYQQGVSALGDRATIESYAGEVITGNTYQYGQDYYLGDIVTVITEFGAKITARITEIIENEDETGVKTIPTFSYALEEVED